MPSSGISWYVSRVFWPCIAPKFIQADNNKQLHETKQPRPSFVSFGGSRKARAERNVGGAKTNTRCAAFFKKSPPTDLTVRLADTTTDRYTLLASILTSSTSNSIIVTGCFSADAGGRCPLFRSRCFVRAACPARNEVAQDDPISIFTKRWRQKAEVVSASVPKQSRFQATNSSC